MKFAPFGQTAEHDIVAGLEVQVSDATRRALGQYDASFAHRSSLFVPFFDVQMKKATISLENAVPQTVHFAVMMLSLFRTVALGTDHCGVEWFLEHWRSFHIPHMVCNGLEVAFLETSLLEPTPDHPAPTEPRDSIEVSLHVPGLRLHVPEDRGRIKTHLEAIFQHWNSVLIPLLRAIFTEDALASAPLDEICSVFSFIE